MIKRMSTLSCEELARKREEFATRLGPHLHPDGFAEFSQYVDRACALQKTDEAHSRRLAQKAAEMLPQLERSVEDALAIRDKIRAKMLEYAEEAMDRYDWALRELAK
jgi:predicted transglutaminase-like cysteine proteinase